MSDFQNSERVSLFQFICCNNLVVFPTCRCFLESNYWLMFVFLPVCHVCNLCAISLSFLRLHNLWIFMPYFLSLNQFCFLFDFPSITISYGTLWYSYKLHLIFFLVIIVFLLDQNGIYILSLLQLYFFPNEESFLCSCDLSDF